VNLQKCTALGEPCERGNALDSYEPFDTLFEGFPGRVTRSSYRKESLNSLFINSLPRPDPAGGYGIEGV
jgi:hypothetical protein